MHSQKRLNGNRWTLEFFFQFFQSICFLSEKFSLISENFLIKKLIQTGSLKAFESRLNMWSTGQLNSVSILKLVFLLEFNRLAKEPNLRLVIWLTLCWRIYTIPLMLLIAHLEFTEFDLLNSIHRIQSADCLPFTWRRKIPIFVYDRQTFADARPSS